MASSGLSAGRPSSRNSQPSVEARALLQQSAGSKRVNFETDPQLRAEFKAWCAANETTIREELERHMRSVVAGGKR